MAVVLLIALGIAGLRSATILWASAIFTLVLVLLLTAVLGAVAIRGRVRMTCLGFSLFGWGYFLFVFWFWPVPNGISAPPFLTTVLLESVQPMIKPYPANQAFDNGPQGEALHEFDWAKAAGTGGIPPLTGQPYNPHHFRRIGHLLAVIVFGFLGGLLGSIFFGLNRATEERHLSGEAGAVQ